MSKPQPSPPPCPISKLWPGWLHNADSGFESFLPHYFQCAQCQRTVIALMSRRQRCKRWIFNTIECTLIGAAALLAFHAALGLKGLLYDPFKDKPEGKK